MSFTSITALAGLLALSTAAVGCMPQQQAPPPVPAPTTSAAPPRTDRHVYRLDFVLTTSDSAGGTPSSTSFTLNLQEMDKGEVTVGKNVPLTAPNPSGASVASARQDVGMKVAAHFQTSGDELILDVAVEMSSFDSASSSIRKVVAKGNALASAGKPALVTTLEDDHKRYQLTVTPTKLR